MYFDIPKKTRQRYLVNAMKEIRRPQEPMWQEISSLALPFRLRLNITDQNQARMATNIYNSTASRALKVLQSGLMTAATDPTSDWVSLSLKDKDRAEYGPHRRWLDEVGTLILQTIEDSNCYENLPVAYGNMAAFGIFALGLEEGFKRSALKTTLYATGRYWFARDDEGVVNTFYEECRATVRQLYIRFGERANFSEQIRKMARDGKWEDWVDVAHLIEPNEDYQPGSPLGTRKRYSDCWWETGQTSASASGYDQKNDDAYIVESGFDLFPVVVCSWSSVEGDVYPTEYPGSESLGDNKGLQIYEKRLGQLVEKGAHPHWIADSALKGELDGGFVPGKTSYVDEKVAGKSIRPAHVVDPGWVVPVREQIQDVSTRILETFHYPTFSTFDAPIAGTDRQMTATEVLERKAEKLLKLVDMYSNLKGRGLKPLVAFTYEMLLRQNHPVFQQIPPDLRGQRVEFIFNGVLAQAQKMNRVSPIQMAIGVAAQIATAQQVTGERPEIFDKFNADQAIDEIATDLKIPATVIRSDEEVAAIRQQRAAAIAQQQQMANIQAATQAAKNLGQAPVNKESALGALLGAGS